MSHHYMEDSGPAPQAKRVSTPPSFAASNTVHAKVEQARKAARASALDNLARSLTTAIAGRNDQREPTSNEDVYVAALAFCREYEASQ